jgi:hypothetical protein
MYKAWLDSDVADWIKRYVRPYLEELLHKAEARLGRHRIVFSESCSLILFYVHPAHDPDNDRESFFQALIAAADEAVVHDISVTEAAERVPSYLRCYARAFPELVEFMRIVLQVEEAFPSATILPIRSSVQAPQEI